jgi:nuclear pore complex protein Nup53
LDKPQLGVSVAEKRQNKHEDFAPPVASIYDEDLPLPDVKPEFSPEVSPKYYRQEIAPVAIARGAASPQMTESIFRDRSDLLGSATRDLGGSEDTWVTVFGFNQPYTHTVLKQFQKYGDIIRYKSGEGNWIHIQYQTKLQAQKALTKNGKFLEDGVMIGVVPFSTKQRSLGQPAKAVSAQPRYQLTSNSYAVEPIAPKTLPVPQNSLWAKVSEYIFGL